VIWAVYNGYTGNGECCVLVPGPTEREAWEQAADAFKADEEGTFLHGWRTSEMSKAALGVLERRRSTYEPNPRWRAERIELPYVCELS
jgi:hypothetical protein